MGRHPDETIRAFDLPAGPHARGPGRGGRGFGSQAGFTLLELAIVMLLMLVVANFTIPRFRSLTDLNMKSAIRRIAGSTRFAYGEAVTKNRLMGIEFDLDERTWKVLAGLSAGASATSWTDYTASVLSASQRLPEGVFFKDILIEGTPEAFYDGKAYTRFRPGGRADTTVIHLADDNDRQWTLVVHPLTGRVKIHEGYEEFLIHGTEQP
ncbi:MAG: GspH/FimT family pseudopilin [Myxococcales bacterium]|nr:GspH/FimT family pseudopilin [Myxococcales bacterium]